MEQSVKPGIPFGIWKFGFWNFFHGDLEPHLSFASASMRFSTVVTAGSIALASGLLLTCGW